jgi:hypothetical protein
MFSSILGKAKVKKGDENKEHKELVDKISKMNLTDMRSYINNKISNFEIDEDGLSEVMRKLLKVNSKTSKRYIEIDDMDSKIKKGFNLVLSVLTNKKITVTTIELVNEFLEMYADIIEKYDKDHKEIYSSRFKDAIGQAIEGINMQAELNKKMKVIGS